MSRLSFRFLSSLLLAVGFVHFGNAQERSLRFFGTGTGDIDRVKIPIDAPHRPIDLSDDMTLEFWMKANLADNGGLVDCSSTSGGDRWITGNTIFDRDVYGAGDFGDYGISLSAGRIVFGVDAGAGSITLCGTSNAANGLWRHIAVTRRRSTGEMQIFVDGVREAIGSGGTGNMSYRDGRSTSFPLSDPYLVIGAEKHDAGPAYPSYNGFIDEVRISNIIRYTSNFTRPSSPFSADANTVGLYRFNEGTGTVIGDSSGFAGGPSNGIRSVGGPSSGPQWSTDTPFTPTSSNGLSGRILRSNGVGEPGVRVILTDLTSGNISETLTDRNGEYSFGALEHGRVYRLKALSPRSIIDPSERLIIYTDQINDMNFSSRPRKKWF
jgi:hypothetical protein